MLDHVCLQGVISARGTLTGTISSRKQLVGSIRPKGTLTGTISTRGQLTARVSPRGVLSGTIAARGQLVGHISGVSIGEEPCETYMLVYEDGTEVPAVFVEDEVTFTATENDIRLGSVAATAKGVVTGTKEIPSYHTTEGYRLVMNGSNFILPIPNYEYTKLQAIICAFNTNFYNSTSAQKIVVEDGVYAVGSTVSESNVIANTDSQWIDFGIINSSGSPCVLRYFTYKEVV